jgi:anti-sigma regulatory factor (Ser/Thr protein kinase)
MIEESEQGRDNGSSLGESPILRLDLDQSPDAPALARAAISGLASDIDIESTKLATLKLLVSELVSNAVIHPEAPRPSKISLLARLKDRMLRVEVTDRGNGFKPRPRDPNRRDGGYGLFLLDKQADRWGVEQDDGNKVWFELADLTRSGPHNPELGAPRPVESDG